MMEKIPENLDFFNSGKFLSEATFRLNRAVNRHSCLERTHIGLEKFVHSIPRYSMYGVGVVYLQSIGPYLIDRSLNQELYLDF